MNWSNISATMDKEKSFSKTINYVIKEKVELNILL
jgi:hypothetical protein